MPQDDDDLPATPKCLFCSQRRDGQRYEFFGGEHMSTKKKRAFLSDVTTTTSEYRKMKPLGV